MNGLEDKLVVGNLMCSIDVFVGVIKLLKMILTIKLFNMYRAE